MNVLIADDHQLILYGIQQVLKNHKDVKQVFTAENLYEVNTTLEKQKIDILFQDVRFGATDARSFVKGLIDEYPDLKVIIVTSILDYDMIRIFLNQGVHGYILKIDCATEILESIDTIKNNEPYLSPKIQQFLKGQNKHKINEPSTLLSDRELEVLKLILDEKTSKEIADILTLSTKTIEKTRAQLYHKFEVNNLAGLVKKAILQGYT